MRRGGEGSKKGWEGGGKEEGKEGQRKKEAVIAHLPPPVTDFKNA